MIICTSINVTNSSSLSEYELCFSVGFVAVYMTAFGKSVSYNSRGNCLIRYVPIALYSKSKLVACGL